MGKVRKELRLSPAAVKKIEAKAKKEKISHSEAVERLIKGK